MSSILYVYGSGFGSYSAAQFFYHKLVYKSRSENCGLLAKRSARISNAAIARERSHDLEMVRYLKTVRWNSNPGYDLAASMIQRSYHRCRQFRQLQQRKRKAYLAGVHTLQSKQMKPVPLAVLPNHLLQAIGSFL
jgi:hypothetical protein